MSFATTLPEFFVGVTSSVQKEPLLSFGNVLGSNIANLTLLAGAGALLSGGLVLKEEQAKRSALRVVLFSFLPLLLLLDKTLSRWDGLILIGLLVLNLTSVYRTKKKEGLRAASASSGKNLNKKINKIAFWKILAGFIFSLIILLFSAEGVSFSGVGLAKALGVPVFLIGILIIALGTNLPEMVFGLRSIKMRHHGMVLGDLIGAVIVNSTLVLGITALIQPFTISSFSAYRVGIFFVILSVLLFYIFSSSRSRIGRKEGVVLLVVYFLFVLASLVF